ncbi:MAG: D-aminoacylase [Tissierellia bacterium]|nr:D-aminoacylase [Tissierellia bacterium]
MYDILIKNGTLVDGTGKEPYKKNVAIKDGKITLVDGDIEATRVIDAKGKLVTPGFIDTHSHSSMLVNEDPYLAPKLFQGITTELVAQDGMGPAPVDEKHISPWKKAMAGLEGEYDFEWKWRSVGDYLDEVEKLDLGPNIAYLAPHGNLRMVAMGLDNRKPTKEEQERMNDELRKAIDEGAFGMSTGMIYPPCVYADIDEFIELGKVLKDTDTIFVTHQRSEADSMLESMDEILEISRQSGCRAHFSHFKICGKNNWDKIPAILEKLDNAKEEGIIVSLDQYPYVAGSTMMSVILPPWVHDGGTEKLIERLSDNELREKMKEDIANGIPGWDNFIDFAGLEGIFITFVKNPESEKYVGMNLVELGEATGKDPYDAIFDLIRDEENIVGLVDFYGTEEHVKTFMAREEQNVCTDGIIGTKPHPRLYGAFVRVLGKYCRDEKLFPVETAIRKMTGKPADTIGLLDRGYLKDGYAADVLVIDFDNVIDVGDYTDPKQLAKGIDYSIVNGKILIDDGKQTPQKAGKVLRYQGRK